MFFFSFHNINTGQIAFQFINAGRLAHMHLRIRTIKNFFLCSFFYLPLSNELSVFFVFRKTSDNNNKCYKFLRVFALFIHERTYKCIAFLHAHYKYLTSNRKRKKDFFDFCLNKKNKVRNCFYVFARLYKLYERISYLLNAMGMSCIGPFINLLSCLLLQSVTNQIYNNTVYFFGFHCGKRKEK